MPVKLPVYVPPARGGEVNDDTLREIIEISRRTLIEGKPFSEAEGITLQLTNTALLEELLNWREKAGVIRELALPDNVIMLRAG